MTWQVGVATKDKVDAVVEKLMCIATDLRWGRDLGGAGGVLELTLAEEIFAALGMAEKYQDMVFAMLRREFPEAAKCKADIGALHAEIARLRATTCEKPGADQCALQWDADHQRAALVELGLAQEFPLGCDSIDKVGEALLVARGVIARCNEECNERMHATNDARRELLAAQADNARLRAALVQLGASAEIANASIGEVARKVNKALAGAP